MEELMRIAGVTFTYRDQCQYGAQVAHGPPKSSPIKKPTGFLSDCKSLASALSKTRAGTRRRVLLRRQTRPLFGTDR